MTEFRFPIASSDVLGLNDLTPKSPQDIAADYDYQDRALEDFLTAETGGTTGTGTSGFEPGDIIWSAATTRANALPANGAAVSRTTYADLFTAIGTTYGVGDGSTTFNVPDITGRVVAGKEASASRITSAGSGIDGATLGAAGGTQLLSAHVHGPGSHTHTLSHTHTMGNHTHTLSNHIHSTPAHQHNPNAIYPFATVGGGSELSLDLGFGSVNVGSVSNTANDGSGVSGVPSTPNTSTPSSNTSDGASTSTTSTPSAADTASAGGGSTGNIQPTIVLNAFIKT